MKAIFLDRDGVINRDPGSGDYIKSWEEFQFLPGAIEAIKELNRNGYEIFVISNQAGVSKSLFSREDLDDIKPRYRFKTDRTRFDHLTIGGCYLPHYKELADRYRVRMVLSFESQSGRESAADRAYIWKVTMRDEETIFLKILVQFANRVPGSEFNIEIGR